MMRLTIVAIFCTATSLSSTVDGGQRRAFNAWDGAHIVPDTIDVAPSQKLSINYDTGAVVNFGNVLTPTQVRDYPQFSWNANPGKFYVLAFVDLDVGSSAQQKNQEFLHYLVGNIPGSDISKGLVLADFMGSGPPQGSGLHRYTFLVYEQPRRLSFNEKPFALVGGNITDRAGFSIRNFTRKYRLGQPVAGNFYLAEWDETVPKLYAEWEALSKVESD